MTDLLFVYGTLRPEAHHTMGMSARARLQNESHPVGTARTQGTLYDLGEYPGLASGSGWVTGTLYQLNDQHNTLEWLDQYEDITGSPDDEYERQQRTVVRVGDQPVKAWVYVLKQASTSATIIPTGDWLSL